MVLNNVRENELVICNYQKNRCVVNTTITNTFLIVCKYKRVTVQIKLIVIPLHLI